MVCYNRMRYFKGEMSLLCWSILLRDKICKCWPGKPGWGPFLESPDNFSGPESYFMSAMFSFTTQMLLFWKLSDKILMVIDSEKHFNKKINDKKVTWRFDDFTDVIIIKSGMWIKLT